MIFKRISSAAVISRKHSSGSRRSSSRPRRVSPVSRNRSASMRSVARTPRLMIRYPEIAFTAFAVTDMPRARRFYEDVLCLQPSRESSENFVDYDIGPGTPAVVGAPDQWQPSERGTSAALEVTDFPATLEHRKAHQIPFVIGPAEYPTCHRVVVRDPEGNLVGLHQRKSAPSRSAIERSLLTRLQRIGHFSRSSRWLALNPLRSGTDGGKNLVELVRSGDRRSLSQ